MLKALKAEGNHKTLYMVSITDEVDKINEGRAWPSRWRDRPALGYSAGLSSLRVLAEDEAASADRLRLTHARPVADDLPTLAKLCRLWGLT